uniref:Peptidase S1 domain-containing protein n=1 Tax=Heliothis virescens TaxID=7102 RepID=A0A2A4J200_HELVI
MSSIKKNIFCLIVLSIVVEIQSLVELPVAEDNEIVLTELAIRNTVNKIFSIFKLRRLPNKAKFTEFALIHNFFLTITLQDHDNLKEIARLAKVEHIDNNTQYFITEINEVLNEDNKSHDTTDDVVTTHIETFIKKLEYLKNRYGYSNNAAAFGINTEVLTHLKTTDNLNNYTTVADEAVDSDGNILSDNEFWKPSGRRIFQGHKERIKRYPFMASVHFFKKFQCGGSIIKSDLVITAASCLQLAWNNRFFRENPAFLSVQVGCDLYEGGDENIPIMQVYFHPDYNPQNLRNNLAIMRLLRILKFGRTVTRIKKIDFDRSPWPLPANTDGITIIGWGAKSSSNIIRNVFSNHLASAELDFYPLKECQDVYSKDFVTYKNFCAGFFSKGGGACNRDVGGPGVAHGVLVGVISFGSPNCGAPDAPTVFTKLGYYTEWIESILEMRTATGVRKTTERPIKISYDFMQYMSTTTEYKIEPVTVSQEPGTVTAAETALPILNLDALRTLDESKDFKDFIRTMFGSQEAHDYLEGYEDDTDKSDEAKPQVTESSAGRAAARPQAVTTQASPKLKDLGLRQPNISLPGTLQVPLASDKINSVRMVTAIEDFDRVEVSSAEDEDSTLPTTTEIPRYTALKNKQSEKSVEESIAKLIDDIDIEEILDFDSGDSSEKKISRNASVPFMQANREKSEQLPKLVSKDSTSIESDNEDSDDLETNPVLALLELTKNKMKQKKKVVEDDKGLAIPVEGFMDFTFRQNASTTGPGVLDIFSQRDLMRLLTEAVADAANGKVIKPQNN